MGGFVRTILVHDWLNQSFDYDLHSCDICKCAVLEDSFWDSEDWQAILERDKTAQLMLRATEEKIIADEEQSAVLTDCYWSLGEMIGGEKIGNYGKKNILNSERENRLRILSSQLEKVAADARVSLVNRYADYCIRIGNEPKLRFILAYIEMKGLFNDSEPMLTLVKQKLDYIRTRKSITEAHKMRSVDQVPRLLKYARSRSYLRDQLKNELENLEAAFNNWSAEDRFRNSRIKIDSKSVAELKSYSNPSREIFATVKASLILLGFESKNIINWGDILTIFTSCKANKTDIVRCFNVLNCKTVDLDTAFESELFLKRFTLDKVNRVSSGAALFYKWSMHKIASIKKVWGVPSSSL
ncbi:uncharacterized protein LOC142335272 [Convolutriloba macropyga]|uniref:uncharacterized protein LOC142335272 n=1 Tax=Convolutriloba macropyga TaxID=536237 RepID=UPI003F522EDA